MTETLDCLVSLRRHSRYAPWALNELVDIAAHLASGSGIGDGRRPTARTCRYWVTEGVVAPPFGMGRGSAWGYQHLVELLIALDSRERGESLREMAERRQESSLSELEQIVAERMVHPMPAPVDAVPEPVAETIPVELLTFVVTEGVELRLAPDHYLSHDSRARKAILARLERDINF